MTKANAMFKGEPEGAPSSTDSNLNSVLSRNIEALRGKQAQEELNASFETKLADRITAITGSMPFVYAHLVVVGLWTSVNVGLLRFIGPFDPTFVILATVASVEAIFLSTFVLISQNRTAKIAQRRAELDLQTGLLAEYEVTRLLTLVSAIAKRLNIDEASDPTLRELQTFVAPEKVLSEIEKKT